MVKDSRRTSKKLTYLTAITLGVLLIAGVIYFVQYSNAEQSKKNIETLLRASFEKNPAICDEIKGGISETDNNPKKNKYGFELGVSIQFKKMDERQAREHCREGVRAAIENIEKIKNTQNR